eukprot:CAMPEP_0202442240 /NCGR_PEP_ID=MMETSP1360-20130828/1701_1 /ASSEMBLY_ACC=CAM_ASM_000848 /TAXON_ID=515479 /ORGANISM="Licmophora paradoxa, Strain CCMP2313" /LENGTH=184 /DNA_ID=CAMNT_0049057553 /DNA_START=45 /DNA_END=599 /DNA_ORIENTATION=+
MGKNSKQQQQGSKSQRDEESNPLVNNPYSSTGGQEPTLGPYHPINLIQRSSILGGCVYGLHRWGVYEKVMHSPLVRHEWFKVGLAASIAILFIKMYVEMYAGKLRGEEVSYKNFPKSTHATIALLILSSIAFHVAIWPAYGMNSIVVMTMIGWGILLQLSLLLPTYIQNIAGVVLLTFFLQEYA